MNPGPQIFLPPSIPPYIVGRSVYFVFCKHISIFIRESSFLVKSSRSPKLDAVNKLEWRCTYGYQWNIDMLTCNTQV